jgi:hypothetical protein
MIPIWLHILSMATIAAGALSALVVAVDELRRPQRMWIMNLVWPMVSLFGLGLALWGYLRYGRARPPRAKQDIKSEPSEKSGAAEPPFAVAVGKAASHCGAGCTMGDIVAEWLAFAVPGIAVALGWGSVFGEKMFAVWVLDFILAFAIGIVFQYFTIAPMRHLGVRDGLIAALKADTLSLAAWQVGMYGFMAFASFYLFGHLLGATLTVDSFEFWFMMQIAMLCGFATSYPINWWLIKAGLKEKM